MVNALEDVESRLKRIKLEAAVIEKHNNKLENQKENVGNKLTANAVVDSEVSFTSSLISSYRSFLQISSVQVT